MQVRRPMRVKLGQLRSLRLLHFAAALAGVRRLAQLRYFGCFGSSPIGLRQLCRRPG